MGRTSSLRLSADQEREAEVLAERMREATEEEFRQLARLLISTPDEKIFGDTAFAVRDIVLRAGAKAVQEHLAQKKTATKEAASSVRRADKQPSSRAGAAKSP